MIIRILKSFKYALTGLKHCYRQPNMIVHACAVLITVIAGFIFHLSHTEWIIIILAIGLVKAAEAFNTSIEKMVDFISPEQNEQAGFVKDIAAGAVLITAISALIIGCIIFIPKIIIMFD